MATRDNLIIRLLISARDQASGTVNGITQSLRGMLTQVLAWGAALLSLNSVVDAAEKLETQMGALRGAIAATGGAAGLTAEDIDRMAREIDEATLGGAANIRAAALTLLTFKSVSKEVFERTLRAAQDLSSIGFGSVEQASVQLGKALEDPLTGLGALTRVGVSFTDQQKAQIETAVQLGQTLEAQKIILAAVEGQVKGVASAAGAGLAGAVDLVGKRMTDLKEIVGGQIIGVWGQLNLQFADFLNQAKQAASEGTIIKDAMVLLGIGVTAVGGAFQIAGTAVGGFMAAIVSRDFSQFIPLLEEANLRIRAQAASMAALSERIGPLFALTADEAKQLAALTGQVATQTQQAGAAAGSAAPQLSALATGYKANAQALELLQAVLDRRMSGQEAWNALRREEAKLTGDLSTQLQLEIDIARQDTATKLEQSTTAARLASDAQRYLDSLRQQAGVQPEVIAQAEKDAVAKQKQADASAAAAAQAALYLKQARQAPQTQALATQNQQLQITLDYESRIAALRTKNLSQSERDASNASAAEVALAKATLARLNLSDKAGDAEKKATQETIKAYQAQAEQYAGQVQDGERAISILERLRDEKIKLLQETSDQADVKAMIQADDQPARKEMAGFIRWANQQEVVIPVRLVTSGGAGGGSLNSLVDQLTRSANAG